MVSTQSILRRRGWILSACVLVWNELISLKSIALADCS